MSFACFSPPCVSLLLPGMLPIDRVELIWLTSVQCFENLHSSSSHSFGTNGSFELTSLCLSTAVGMLSLYCQLGKQAKIFLQDWYKHCSILKAVEQLNILLEAKSLISRKLWISLVLLYWLSFKIKIFCFPEDLLKNYMCPSGNSSAGDWMNCHTVGHVPWVNMLCSFNLPKEA